MTRRGWSSIGLCVMDEADQHWTVAEASKLLGPPQLTDAQVRFLITAMQIQPTGTRMKDGHDKRGRRPRVYRAIDLIKAYDVLSKAA